MTAELVAMPGKLVDAARAADVRLARRADGGIVVYRRTGHRTIGRLHHNPSGWSAVEDATGDAVTDQCPATALGHLLRLADEVAS